MSATHTMLPPSEQTNAFGPDSPCNLDICPIEWSIYTFRPSLAGNITFLALFALIGIVHGYLGFRWKSWGFMAGMLMGCVAEIAGYIGRIMLYYNPFSFNGFMVQIVCLTIAPVFYTASIYVTLSTTIMFLGPELSRFKPQLFIWIFIPFDIVCLILQAAGGALSTGDNNSDLGVTISMVGLVLQVVVLVFFIIAFSDYMIRYIRSKKATAFGWRLSTFFAGLSAAIILVLTRCIYRVAELQDGYDGDLIKHEIPFIILEGVVVFLAAVALCWGHPGLVFNEKYAHLRSGDSEKGINLQPVSDSN